MERRGFLTGSGMAAVTGFVPLVEPTALAVKGRPPSDNSIRT
ncbi:twin-arginine translocation signal domain-containing protein [Streptomyces sp. NPDC094031]